MPTEKTPIRAVFSGGTATGLAEYQANEVVGVTFGGIGTNTLTANSILLGNTTSAIQSSAIQIVGTTLSSTNSSIINVNEGLVVEGTLNVTGTTTLGTTTLGATTISGNLTVTGTTTTVNSTTIDITNSFTFEGSTADSFETTLGVVNPTADRTINLPNVSGTIITTGNITDLGSPIGDLSEISVVANDDVFLAIDTSGGGLKKISRSTIVSGLAASSALSNIVEDTTPQLGGNLDVNGNSIVSVSNGNISIVPNGSGKVILDGDGSSSGVSITDGLIDIRSSIGQVSKIKFYCEVSNAHFQTLQAAPHSSASSAVLTLPVATGTLIGTGDSGTVTNTMLTNSFIKIVDDSSTTSVVSLGESLKFTGGTGIDTTVSGDNVTFSVDNTVPTKAFAIAQAVALG
jgi:hypothetical protein